MMTSLGNSATPIIVLLVMLNYLLKWAKLIVAQFCSFFFGLTANLSYFSFSDIDIPGPNSIEIFSTENMFRLM